MAIEPLRPFQSEDFEFFKTHLRGLLLYEPRLGKTVVASNLIGWDKEVHKVLITCPKNALLVWWAHLHEWLSVVYPDRTFTVHLVRGQPAVRAQLWKQREQTDLNIYICTYGTFLKDFEQLQLPSVLKAGSFDTVIIDEFQRIRNHKSKAFKALSGFVYRARRFLGLSGTLPSKRGPMDFYSAMNLCNKYLVSSYWKFAYMFCEVIKTSWGNEIVGVRNIDNFHRFIGQYAKIRERHIVAPQMPQVQRIPLYVEMNVQQEALYRSMELDDLVVTPDNIVVAANTVEKFMRFRQIITCPAIFDSKLGLGAAFEDILDRLEEAETTDERHIVIFSNFRAAQQHWEKALIEKDYPTYILHGGMDPFVQRERIQLFERHKGIILCTTQYAQAFSLATANACYHIGWSYDPNDNKQAEDRLVPQQGIHPILSHYYVYKDTIDMDLVEMVNQKSKFIALTKPR